MNKNGFSRLRIAAASAGTLLGVLFGGASRSARAASTALPVSVTVAAANAHWTVASNTVCPSYFGFGASNTINSLKQPPFGHQPNGKGSSCGFGIEEGSLLSPVRNDAFDGAFGIAVGTTIFKNPTGSVDLTGTTITSGTATINGLGVQVQYYFLPTQPVVRAVFSFTNTTGAPITTTATVGSNLGSDSNTRVETTENGNTTVETTDRWIITSDAGAPTTQAPTGGPDPVLLWIRQGLGASTTVASSPQIPSPNDNFADAYNITVPAGQTRRLMVFARLNTSVAEGTGAAAGFTDLPTLQAGGFLAGLSAQQQSEIVNWAAGPAGPTVAVSAPALDDWSKLTLLLGMGAAGAVALRLARRKPDAA